ncbi:MAG: DUF1232 domain-containing protein [Gemmatimonadetes bacterium]|nr:DUF1232 domain-containing protein [Gemmatimonadota bacterium]
MPDNDTRQILNKAWSFTHLLRRRKPVPDGLPGTDHAPAVPFAMNTKMPTRAEAVALLEEWVVSPGLRKHMYAVEAAVRHYARLMGEDEDIWGLAGLLHDLDWEKHPDKHPQIGVARLRELGYPEVVVHAIEAHAYPDGTDVVPESLLDRVLYGCDELTGLVYACCLVRRNGIDDLKPRFVARKMKEKAFARGVHRDAVQRGFDLIGLRRTKHIKNVIEGVRTVADALEVRGVDQARRRGERPDPGNEGRDGADNGYAELRHVDGKGRDNAAEYSDKSFWKSIKELVFKIGRGAGKSGKEVVYRALVLHYCLQDPDTPTWARCTIMGALGYFILPADTVPDILPGVGKVDDIVVLAAASAVVLVHIKPEHKQRAKDKMKEWFGDGDDSPAE